MKLYPAKLERQFEHPIFESDDDYKIVDGLTRGIFDVYFDPCGCPEDAIILYIEDAASLRRELESGCFKDEDERLRKIIEAMLRYMQDHPTDQGYCFACDNYT